jgi:hypothetical protein
VNKILAAAAIASLAGLTACTSNPESPGTPAASPSESAATVQAPPTESSSPGTAAAGGVKGACELFNSLYGEYKAIPGNDPNAYEDIYLKSQAAKDTVSGDLTGLFAALSLLAIDHSGAAENSGEPEQASKDAVRDAVFANADTCTAGGVTLRL